MRWRTDTQHDPSLLRTRGVYITPYILSNKLFSFAGLFQHHLHPVAANRTQREVKQHGHHSRYYCTYYCISDAKKRKQKTTKNTSYSKHYFGEIKNELFFKERGPKSYFFNHLFDSARRRLKRKLLSTRYTIT